jgi:hypothetical protein
VSWGLDYRVACLSLVFWPKADECVLISIGPPETSNRAYLPVEARAAFVARLIVGGLKNCP